jgi:GTP cyclohydrolase II
MAAAAAALRRGDAIQIGGKGGNFTAYALESLSDAALARLKKAKHPHIVLSHARARTLKIRLYTPEVVAIPLAKEMRGDELRSLADPTSDLTWPLKGPFNAVRDALPEGYAAGVRLAKLGGLLPALVLAKSDPAKKPRLSVKAEEIFAYDREAVKTLKIVTRARVPLEDSEKSELVAFRSADGGAEHYAIIIGDPPTNAPVLARLHSECFTGDLLGSLKCDCGAQLRGAIAAIAKEGGGVLLYLAQEGRGIGLINKLRAYRLQDQGFDTVDANERLGFEGDERLYNVAARMLTLLGYKSVRLMTNNPDKVSSLEEAGILVAERVPHKFPSNTHNEGYLRTKAERSGHLF